MLIQIMHFITRSNVLHSHPINESCNYMKLLSGFEMSMFRSSVQDGKERMDSQNTEWNTILQDSH